MIRSKLELLGLCAMVLGVMAISASGAQAAGSWLVGATEVVKVGEGVNLSATVTGEIDTPEPKFLTHLLGLTVTVTCTNLTTSGITLKGEGKLSEGGKVVFTGCTVVAKDSEGNSSGNCTVKSSGTATGTIASEEFKGELVLGGANEVLIKVEPKGESFVTKRFEGPECLLPLSNKVTGVIYAKDCQGFAETFKVKHLIEQGPSTSLSVGADTVEHLETSLDGSFWLFLTGEHTGKEWRAMGV
jgi:hypothetical protein